MQLVQQAIAVGTLIGMVGGGILYFKPSEEAAAEHEKILAEVETKNEEIISEAALMAANAFDFTLELKLELEVQRANDELRRLEEIEERFGPLSEEGERFRQYWQDRKITAERDLQKFRNENRRPNAPT